MILARATCEEECQRHKVIPKRVEHLIHQHDCGRYTTQPKPDLEPAIWSPGFYLSEGLLGGPS